MSRVVVAIEYGAEDRPFSIFTRERSVGVWDAEWCRTNQTLYVHQSGAGGSVYFNRLSGGARSKAWVAPGEVFTTSKEVTPGKWASVEITREELAEMGFDLLDAPLADPFADTEESETHYCPECDDQMPTNGYGDPCEHTTWCEKNGWWVTIKDGRHVSDDDDHAISEGCRG